MKAGRILSVQLKIILAAGICFALITILSGLTAPEEIRSSYDVSVTGMGIWVLLFLILLIAAELCWFTRKSWRNLFESIKREYRRILREAVILFLSGAAGALIGHAAAAHALENYHDYWVLVCTVGTVLFVLQLRMLFKKESAADTASFPVEISRKRNFLLWFPAVVLILLIVYEMAEAYYASPGTASVLHYAAPFWIAAAETFLLSLLFRKKVLTKQENAVDYRKLFTAVFVILAAGYLFVFLPHVSPDEWHHYLSAYRISDLLTARISPDSGSVLMRAGDLAFFNGHQLENSAQYFAWVTGETRILAESAGYGFLEMPMATNAVVGYFPSAIGITIARILHLGAVPAYYLGRLTNIAVCAVILSAVMKKLPAYRSGLFAAAVLPMMLHLTASYSYDGLIFCLCALFIAQVIRMILQPGPASARDRAVCLICAMLIAPAKFVYIPLVFLILLIPADRLGVSKKRSALEKALFIAAALASVAITAKAAGVLAHYSASASEMAAVSGPRILSSYGEEGYTAGLMLDNAGGIFFMNIRTFITRLSEYFLTMGGTRLGWWDVEVPSVCIIFAFLMLFLSVNTDGTKRIAEKIPARGKLFVFLLMAAVAAGIMLAMTYAWTPLSYEYTEGVQGRYFLPLLLLLPLLVHKGIADTRDRAMKYITLYMAMMNGWILIHLFRCTIVTAV